MRIVVFLVTICGLLLARENPFRPVGQISPKNIKPTNVIRQYENFDKKNIQPPNNARVLKYVKVGYQTLDGSIKEQRVDINSKIDHHEDLIIATNRVINPPTPVLEHTIKDDQVDIVTQPKRLQNHSIRFIPHSKKEPKKAPNKNYINKILAKNDSPSHKKNITKTPTKSLDRKPILTQKNYSFAKNISFSVSSNTIIVNTNDKLIRDFTVLKPQKIVLDFKSNKSFYTKTLDISRPPFKNVTFGSHKGFYRASFLLDSPYKYRLEKKAGKVIIYLK